MKITTLIFAFSILIFINAYVIWRGWQALSTATFIRPFYLTAMILLFLSMFAGMIFSDSMNQSLSRTISFAGHSYMILFIYLFLAFLCIDIVRSANHFVHFIPWEMQSFRLWTFAGALLVIGMAMIAGNYKFNSPEIVTLHLVAEKPTQNKTLKIVAASDLHLGVSIDKKRLQRYVELINNQKPDVILLIGDVSDRALKPVINQNMHEELSLLQAQHGVYAINGNHEHYAEHPEATADYLTQAGINVLRDEVQLIDSSFYVAGRDDRTNRNRKPLADIIKHTDKSKPTILLDHQPYNLNEAQENNIDLQLSGHTHNGQFFPGNLIVKKMYEIAHGYLKKGDTHYYVSSGLGLWGPQYRIGTQSEIVVIHFRY